MTAAGKSRETFKSNGRIWLVTAVSSTGHTTVALRHHRKGAERAAAEFNRKGQTTTLHHADAPTWWPA